MLSQSPHALPSVTVIIGPTSSGKTEFALRWADHFSGEVVSADSCQVYRGMDIGTGKVSKDITKKIPHHLIDIMDPDEEMTAAEFVNRADDAIANAASQNNPVIITGGTGLYVDALLFGLFEGPSADMALRHEFSQWAMIYGVAALHDKLSQIDTISANKINSNDLRRIIRALEVYELTGVPLSEHHRRHKQQGHRYQAQLIGIAPERDLLYKQITARVSQMLAHGWIEEVKTLRENGYGAELHSQQAIGYREIHRYLDGMLSKDDMIRLIMRNSRRYARRQLSWYRPKKYVMWYNSQKEIPMIIS